MLVDRIRSVPTVKVDFGGIAAVRHKVELEAAYAVAAVLDGSHIHFDSAVVKRISCMIYVDIRSGLLHLHCEIDTLFAVGSRKADIGVLLFA